MSDDDEERRQIAELEDFLNTLSDPDTSSAGDAFLREALYTLEENGRMEYRIDERLIPVIWKLVQAAITVSPTELNRITQNIRM